MKKGASTTATVIVLDVGKGMDGGGPGKSYLEQSVDAIAHLVEQKILHPSAGKRELVSLVIFGCHETNNALMEHGYQHVSVVREMFTADVKMLKALASVSPGEHEGDFVDALIVATDLLMRLQEPCKMKLFLFTGGYARSNVADLDRLTERLREIKVGVNVIGVNFFEPEEEDQPDERAVPASKKKNEAAIRKFVESVEGRCYSLQDGLKMLSEYRTKTVRQVPTYTGNLELGDVKVPVKMFVKAKKTAFPSMKKLSAYSQLLRQQNEVDGVEDDPEQVASMVVGMERDYVGVVDPDSVYDKGAMLRGYRYGRTIIPFQKQELSMLTYKAERTLKVIGFVLKSSIPRHYFMGSPELLAAVPGDDVAARTIASLVKGMLPDPVKAEPNSVLDNLERVALVRLVKQKSGGAPKLGCLIPYIKQGQYYGFYFHRLPFAEDIREFEFPGLHNSFLQKLNMSPSPAQLSAMDALVDQMDLGDALNPSETFNPAVLHLYEALRYRASHVPMTTGNVIDPTCVKFAPVAKDQLPMSVDEARRLPEMEDFVRQTLEPSPALWKSADALPVVQTCRDVFKLEPIKVDKSKRKAFSASVQQDIPELTSYRDHHPLGLLENDVFGSAADKGEKRAKKDVKFKMTLNQLLQGAVVDTIGTLNPVADFEKMVSFREADMVVEALQQMQAIIRKLVRESVRGHFYSKALDCMVAMRKACVSDDELVWNDFLMQLRNEYKGTQFDDFWREIVKLKLTLIDENESALSEVTPQQAIAFLSDDDNTSNARPSSVPQAPAEDEVDLFGMME